MFVTLPSIRFPLPVQALPPLPESTVEPMPPGDDPRLANAIIGMSPRSWYKYSVLQNSDSYPNEFFSWESSDVHMGDVVVPSLALPEKYPESKEEDHATGWMMVCFTCPFAGDRGEADRNRTTGYPFCDERMLSREPLVSWSTLEESDLEVPISNATDEESIMACTVELNLRVSMTTEDPSAPLEVLSSQFFIANRTLRGPESEYPQRRYRYNETFPKGVQDDQVQLPDDSIKEHEPFFVPTPTTTYWWEATSTSTTTYWWEATSTSGYGYSDATRGRSSDEDEDLRSKTGVMIGTIVPFLVLTALIACFWRWKRDQKRPKEVSAPVPRNFDPAADARRQAALSERRYSARRDFITAEVAAARNLSGRTEYPSRQREPNETVIPIQDEPEELPPAYHKVVTNQERMEIEQRMHAEGTTPQGWPPSYRDARNAVSTSLSRPVPAASTPEQDRALYPALPSSPPRW